MRCGYGGTTLSGIVRSLGISKTTLYSRYASKEELFRAIVSSRIAALSVSSILAADVTLALEEGLRTFGIKTLEVSFEGDLLQINRLIYGEANRFPELAIAAAERSEHGIEQVAQFIAACAVRDGIPCSDPKGVATSFIFMLRGWYVNFMLTNEPVSPVAMRRFVERSVAVLIEGRGGW